MTYRLIALLAGFTHFLLSLAFAQLADAKQDFSAPVQWGPGSFQMQWGATQGSLRTKGDEGMSGRGGDYFAVMQVDDWVPSGQVPYERSIVSRVVWPLGIVAEQDVGKTMKFSGLFGWYGGEPLRVKDLVVSGGFFAGDTLLQGLDSGGDFLFESADEKDWAEVTSTHKVKPDDAGKEIKFVLQVQSKQELPGFPAIATSDWKLKISP